MKTSLDFRRGQRAAYDFLFCHVERMITARVLWAQSDEGRLQLGPGSPTIPGLQDLYAIRDIMQASYPDD